MGVSHATVIRYIKASWAQTYAQIIIQPMVFMFYQTNMRLQEWIVLLAISIQSAILYFDSFQASSIWGSSQHWWNDEYGYLTELKLRWTNQLTANIFESCGIWSVSSTGVDHVMTASCQELLYWLKQIDLCDGLSNGTMKIISLSFFYELLELEKRSLSQSQGHACTDALTWNCLLHVWLFLSHV